MMICVDTGGTKTLVCRMSQTGEILQQLRFPTPRQYAAYSDQLIAAITSLTGGESVTTISLALPGVVKNNVGLWCPNLGWRDVAIAATLQPHWPAARIVVENDANLAGLHEINCLAPAPALGLYITISTGIGIGAVVNGTISPALRHSEAGHMQLLWDGRLQAWEDFASGRAIANGRDEGFTKLIFDAESGLIIGGGIVGTHAGDMIGEICLAIEMGCDAEDIGKTIHPHPTLGESIGMAAEVALGTCTDLPAQKKK